MVIFLLKSLTLSDPKKYFKDIEIFNCAREAALATGTELEIESGVNSYDAMVGNKVMVALFAAVPIFNGR